MAGLISAGVICEIMNDDGTMARVPDLVNVVCAEHGLLMVTVADLIRYRLQHERSIQRVGEGVLPTAHGEFRMIAYENEIDQGESHVALLMGDVTTGKAIPVRVHTHSLAEDVFGLAGADPSQPHRRVVAHHRPVRVRSASSTCITARAGFGIDRTVEPHRILFQREQRAREGEDRSTRTLRQVGLGGQILSDLGIRRIPPAHQHANPTFPHCKGLASRLSSRWRSPPTPRQS